MWQTRLRSLFAFKTRDFLVEQALLPHVRGHYPGAAPRRFTLGSARYSTKTSSVDAAPVKSRPCKNERENEQIQLDDYWPTWDW